jgi:hypothetical protein
LSQYINLFNPALQKRGDALSARVLLSAMGAAVFVMALAAIWAQYRAGDLSRQARDGDALVKQQRDKLVSLAKGAAERKPDASLAAELARTEAMLRTRGDLIRLVESGAIGKTDGFSEQLRAFARQTMNGLWLTGFSINADGSEMEIDGKALDAELLPAYIRRLNSERVFHGRSFAMLNVNRVQEETLPGPNTVQRGGSALPGHDLPAHVAFSLSGKPRNASSAGRP